MNNYVNYFFSILVIATAMFSSTVNADDFAKAASLFAAAQSENRAYQSEQQRIREYRLKQWNEQQVTNEQFQSVPTNTAFSEPQKAAPEADDLFAAALNGNVNIIGRLLSEGLDINISNNERETALHMAASRGHYSTVIYLVNNGAYVNARTVKNWIPLHHAVRFRHPNIVNYLLQHGSSASLRTSDGYTAADMARNTNNHRLLGILGAR